MAETISSLPDKPLRALPGYSVGEIIQICRTESVRRLSDILLRRTAIAMEGLLTSQVVTETADIAASALGWNAARKEAEIQLMHVEMKRRAVPDAATAKAAA